MTEAEKNTRRECKMTEAEKNTRRECKMTEAEKSTRRECKMTEAEKSTCREWKLTEAEKSTCREWIVSEHSFFELNLKEVIKYKDLLFLLVKRDFIAQYKQTVLGPLWAILQPLFNTLIYTLIFGTLAKLSATDAESSVIPGFLFYMAGSICWTYFSGTMISVSNTFLDNRGTMEKVYYPRIIIPLATSLSHMISFAIQFVMFIALYVVYYLSNGIPFETNTGILLLIPTVLQLMLASIGFGIVVSSLTTKYRDLSFALGFVVQLWQFASPVVYGLTLITANHSELLGLYLLNPMAVILTSFRYAVFGTGFFRLSACLISWGETIAVFGIGLLLFNKMQRSFVDTI